MVPAHQLPCPLQCAQRPQAQKVDLQQADLVHSRPVKLCHQISRAGLLVQRKEIIQRLISYHHACRVNRGVPGHTFQPQGHVDNIMNGRILLVAFLQFRFCFQGIGQLDIQNIRNHLGDFIRRSQRHSHGSANIA